MADNDPIEQIDTTNMGKIAPPSILDRRMSPGRNRIFEAMMGIMLLGVVFLAGVVVWAILAGNPEADKINVKLDRQLTLLQQQVKDGEIARNANACTGYQNHRAIEEALRDIARLNHIASGKPRVLPSNETIKACKAVHIEIDEEGIPQISNVQSDARPPAVPE